MPTTSYSKVDGKFKANIGNIHLEYAYGGVAVYQIVSEGGYARNISKRGHVTKREIFIFLEGFIAGLLEKSNDQN